MNILTRQINKLQKERGFDIDKARKIVYEQQLKNWHIEPWTFILTEKGKEYSKLTSKEREELRNKKYFSSEKDNGS